MAAPVYIEEAVLAALEAAPKVSDICADRIYPLELTQGTKLPAVVVQRIHSSPDHTLSGYTSESVTLMLNCFALDYWQAKELALAVREALAVAPLNAVFDGDRDLLNESGDVFCVSAEYRCQQTGGYCHG
ncbi:DUF3168 domain-containing protein [Desulfovibrio sp. OttesenSCG-928-G11]|nr:DUF3168 domain-containing protein [Desulfovibrio sp. OttesenSCG-928-G11]